MDTIDYKIAIPSYKRPEVIKQKTLRVLNEYKIPKERITIFVADEEEYQVYKKSLNKEYELVIGVPTIGLQRNFIERYYKEGTKLVMFDDDIDEVLRKNEDTLVPLANLEKEFIIEGFKQCEKVGAKTFGMYAAANHYFMKERVYNKICYIIASMFGVIVEHDKFLERYTNHGEDYEYSIRQYIKNGCLVRLDYITAKSNYYKEPGGLQTFRTAENIYNSIKWIQDEFPEYCTMYIRKTTGHAELRLKDKTGDKQQVKLF